jgi:SAM-dependent methyltransferase
MSAELKEAVREKYGAVARSGTVSEGEGTRKVAAAFGYSADELESIPADANMGLSCGNPTAFAELKPGEVVVDLGCGGGLDVFLAAQKVGPSGRAIGIDMTADMIDRAKRNAAEVGATNVEFHLAEIERLPLADGSVDCVISNCVLNLVPDKPKAFAEIHRILKPGGRLRASDIALKKPLPPELADDIYAFVGCIAGAILVSDYRAGLEAAGFKEVRLIDAGSDLNAYALMEDQAGCCSPAMVELGAPAAAPAPANPLALVDAGGCCSPTSTDADLHARLTTLLKTHNVNDYAASVKVEATR